MSPEGSRRADLLRELGGGSAVVDELLPLTGPLFSREPTVSWPPRDEAHVADWRRYAEEAASEGALPALQRRLIQLRFQVAAGISQTEEYRRATRRGELHDGRPPLLHFDDPAGLELHLLPTLGGSIPALVAGCRGDFETLVRVFSARNEPVPVPASMGACLVRGLTNWDRLRAYRRAWEGERSLTFPGAWERELLRLQTAGEKHRYQDRFLILSRGPYSDVPAVEAGHGAEEWALASLRIREEHEGAHYLTLRAGAELRDAPADELLADWLGLLRATGSYSASLAHRFLGLQGGGDYRAGGRLENYLGAGLTPAALRVLCRLLERVASVLESLVAPREDGDLARLFLRLSAQSLEEIALSRPAGSR